MSLVSSYTLGLVFIFLVSVIWAAASILVQFLYTDKSFDSPFLLTYIGTSLFVILLPTHRLAANKKCCDSPHPNTAEYDRIPTVPASSSPTHGDQPVMASASPVEEPSAVTEVVAPTPAHDEGNPAHPNAITPWSTRDHIVAAAKIAPVWFVSNYAYNASLKFTSITSSTVLASTGSLFTFLFALMLGDEHFSIYKLGGVLLGMAGSILTGLHDVETTHQARCSPDESCWIEMAGTDPPAQENYTVWGDVLGLISAVGYGGYAVMVRVLCPRDESLMSMPLFLGFVGMWNMTVLSPLMIYQLYFANDAAAATLTWLVLGCLIVKGLLDNVLSDYLWARAVVLTSATVATVGLGLTIPLAFASDVLLGRPNVMDTPSVVGALAVLVAFTLVNVGQQQVDGDEVMDGTTAAPPETEVHSQSHTAQRNEDHPTSIIRQRHPMSMECTDRQSYDEDGSTS